ncbi:ubiquinone anaerobic biosynthesis accessory factor UbiT [Gimibacter soli]|uniref:SCP2 sterol-binding domain-containing protein n=1 Tax=Gimibacter soli TaxID=3024400 RepID=A0AAE9XSP1_9PROT|nr:SCP2 sterol-binding domain-containing protein [Gimibacter soli]WCL55549.1 SCP2 sterol-binding domain-containing protein [Gimibacter soli]
MTDTRAGVALARRLLSPLPLLPLNRFLVHFSRHLTRRHPAVIRRLEPVTGKRFLITATDLGLSFVMETGPGSVSVTAVRREHVAADVRVRGSFMALLHLLEGQLDGDALFFSRDISVEGDTEALLTLRNALDSEDIDLRSEIVTLFGPFAGLVDRLATEAVGTWARLLHTGHAFGLAPGERVGR